MADLSSSQHAMPVRVSLEPVYNMLNSFSLLSEVGRLPGLNSKIVQAATALSAEQLHTNRLLFEGLRDALTPEQGQEREDFPVYLKSLSEQNPSALRARMLERLRARFARRASSEDTERGLIAPDAERLLGDVQAYLTCVEFVQVDTPFDAALHTEVHHLLNDAPALHRLLLSHLETLWKTAFEVEWKRVQSSLRWQANMFTFSLGDEEGMAADIFSHLTGRELAPETAARLVAAQEIILVPSWHTGHNVTLWESDGSVRLFFSEPPNYDVGLLRATPVGRSELRARLSALADETRLHILELLARQDELPAQDIIAELGLSQSNVSRHLKQLVSAGFLYERRGEGANKTYRLSSFYFDRTARALQQIASGEQAHTGSEEAQSSQKIPQELKRFLDRSGKLTTWPPARQRDKLLILEYLASFFEPGRIYNEKEVNEILLLHSAFKDAAALRRALYEFRFMSRTRDGSRYWLIGTETPEEE